MIELFGQCMIEHERRGKMRNKEIIWRRILFFILLITLIPSVLSAIPSGPDIINKGVENGTVRPATELTTSGGTIATLIINTTTQNPRWKAYVGNVTGKLILEDARNYSIYEWSISSVAGEVYVTRNNSINWSGIQCPNSSHIAQEEIEMKHNASADDSISNTFTLSTHSPFWTAATEFTADKCNNTLITYVNDSAQDGTANFQEILLWDGASMVYTTILENKTRGFDLGYYDFQMIVPEKGWAGPVSSTPYYFYVELI